MIPGDVSRALHLLANTKPGESDVIQRAREVAATIYCRSAETLLRGELAVEQAIQIGTSER